MSTTTKKGKFVTQEIKVELFISDLVDLASKECKTTHDKVYVYDVEFEDDSVIVTLKVMEMSEDK